VDSAAWLDNVVLRNGGLIDGADFNGGTLTASWNTWRGRRRSVTVETATIVPDVASPALRIDEDAIVSPTIAYRDFAASAGTVLEFDLGIKLSGTAGFFGLDELVFRLLNPAGAPLARPDGRAWAMCCRSIRRRYGIRTGADHAAGRGRDPGAELDGSGIGCMRGRAPFAADKECSTCRGTRRFWAVWLRLQRGGCHRAGPGDFDWDGDVDTTDS